MKNRGILWKLATVLSTLFAVLFCGLWIKHVVPAAESANWITAIATVAALIAAGIAAGAALGQLKLLRLDAEARAKDERLAQARRVFLVTTPPSSSVGEGKLVLYNNSTEPVEHIELHIRTPEKVIHIIHGTTLTPTGLDGTEFPLMARRIAEEVRPWQGRPALDADGNHVGGWGAHPYEVRMIFRDAGGRTWLRREGHGLSEVVGDRASFLPSKPLSLLGD